MMLTIPEQVIILLTLHCLADYPLQGDFLATMKGKNPIMMISHCIIWTGLIYFGLAITDNYNGWELPFLYLGHMAIDYWKCSRSGNGKELTTDLVIDQVGHFLQIFICMAW